MKRRTFIRTGMASVAALAVLGTNTQVYAAEKTKKTTTLKTPQQEDAFHLGMAGWTFNKFDLKPPPPPTLPYSAARNNTRQKEKVQGGGTICSNRAVS